MELRQCHKDCHYWTDGVAELVKITTRLNIAEIIVTGDDHLTIIPRRFLDDFLSPSP